MRVDIRGCAAHRATNCNLPPGVYYHEPCGSRVTTVELIEQEESVSDAAVVEAFRNGDRAAFDDVVRRYKDRIYNVVYRYLGNHEDAQDVAQEAFVRAYQKLGQFEGRAKLSTWLHSIAANLAKNRVRDRSRKGRNKGVSLDAAREDRPGTAERWVGTNATPEHLARQRESEAALQEALNELPAPYRLVFVLRTFDGLSYDEIAAVAECPKGTVKSRLNHARTTLHNRLREQGVI